MAPTTAGFIVAAPSSGAGKTTVTLGLMGALTRRGLAVAPFKAGPDYIDPGLHRLVAGRSSQNLDTWMMGQKRVQAAFAAGAADADVAVVEGVMGLFDGGRGDNSAGSTAHLAATLNLPVVLVVDCAGMADSVAAVVHGFATLDTRVAVCGVILNRVASKRHLEFLTDALARRTNVPVLGHLMREQTLSLPSRHLGLVTAQEMGKDAVFERIIDQVAAGVDLDALLAVAGKVETGSVETPVAVDPVVRLGVATDAAFSFVYPDNLKALAQAGAEIVPFSPLADKALPERLDGLYLPGGYPEIHAAQLSANSGMRQAIKAASENDLWVFAECGGLIYLSEGVTDQAGEFHPFCGVLPARCTMEDKRVALGYREITLSEDHLLGKKGAVLKGHEFRYSRVDEAALDKKGVSRTLTLARRGGGSPRAEGFLMRRTVATYAHLVLTDDAAASWVAHLRQTNRCI